MSKASETSSDILAYADSKIFNTHLSGDNLFNQFDNDRIFNVKVSFIVSSRTFDDPVFYSD